MKNDVFIAKLARGAAATAIASAFVLPQNQTDAIPDQHPAEGVAYSSSTNLADAGAVTHSEGTMFLRIAQSPDQWDKTLEREFRALALLELTKSLPAEKVRRLELLNRWRNELLCPVTADEVLLGMKRDNLLSRMEKLLKEYVEFKEVTSKKRFTS